jgi:hypothetical protein
MSQVLNEGGAAGGPGPGNVKVKDLDVRHPEYEARYGAWLDLSLLYEGGAALKAQADRLLKKRPREDDDVYTARLDRFTYQNILGTGLGWYGAAMFDTVPEFFFNGGSGSKFYTDFLQDCDGVGTTYVDFFKRAFQAQLTYGACWVLTDLRSLGEGEEEPRTLEDQRSRGLLDPHVAYYTPLNVINWQVDALGQLRWAVVRVESQRQEFLGEPMVVTAWYYYDRVGYKVYEDVRSVEEQVKVARDEGRMAKLVRSGTHCLQHVERVPLRRLALSGGLWIANRSYLLLVDHLNQDNTLGWALFMSNLAMPVIIGDFDASGMTANEAGFMQFPAGTTYEWSEPEGKSFIHSAKRVESLREECFRSMNLQAQGRSMKATPAMQSGRSKILEMAPAKQILAGMGDDLRQHMQDVLNDVKDARREPEVEPDVRGFSFQDDMSTEEVFAVNSLISMKIPSPTLERYVYRKVAKAWMPDANRDQLKKVYDEIEEGPTREEREKQELGDRVELARSGMAEALKDKGQPLQPPGRGGSGPSVKSKSAGKSTNVKEK